MATLLAPGSFVNVFIRQLTGIRFVAAAWVLLYHLQGPLNTIHVFVIPGLGDVARVGRLGVDLFFAKSMGLSQSRLRSSPVTFACAMTAPPAMKIITRCTG